MPDSSHTVDHIVQWPTAIGKTPISLEPGQRIEDPTRPDTFIYGPLELHFWRFPDGGIELKVLG